ncbi:MAG: SDR family NAD(P)-dependent oxidoreductase [Casimicrobiaceae bacterium]
MPLPDPQQKEVLVDLHDRVVIVTGATGGLGEAVARASAAAGATVVLHGRIVPKLETLYDSIVAAGYPEPTILPLDLRQAGSPEFHAAALAIERQLGRLDAVVHTAATLGSLGPIEHQAFDRWLDVLRVNVAAPMGLTRALLPLLARAHDASVVFTLDTRASAPRAYWGAYGAAKAGLYALAATLADEWENRHELRVNAVVPGPMHSPLRTLSHPGEDKASLPRPARLVSLYLHLIAGQVKSESGKCIDASAWLTGSPALTSLLPVSTAR